MPQQNIAFWHYHDIMLVLQVHKLIEFNALMKLQFMKTRRAPRFTVDGV